MRYLLLLPMIAVLVITGSAATLADDNNVWRCVPGAHYLQAQKLLQDGRVKIKLKQFSEASKTLKAGLAVLDYSIGENGGIDDSGMALGVAELHDRRGDFEIAATMREQTLEERLEHSRPVGSADCQRAITK